MRCHLWQLIRVMNLVNVIPKDVEKGYLLGLLSFRFSWCHILLLCNITNKSVQRLKQVFHPSSKVESIYFSYVMVIFIMFKVREGLIDILRLSMRYSLWEIINISVMWREHVLWFLYHFTWYLIRIERFEYWHSNKCIITTIIAPSKPEGHDNATFV